MNRRTYLSISIGLTTMTAGCISNNSIEYTFESINIHEEIYNADNPLEFRNELPRVQETEENVFIDGLISHGDCEEPYIPYVTYNQNKKQIKAKVSTKSTKNILDKVLNPGCTLALREIEYRINIPKKDKNIQSVHIIEEKTSNENTDQIKNL